MVTTTLGSARPPADGWGRGSSGLDPMPRAPACVRGNRSGDLLESGRPFLSAGILGRLSSTEDAPMTRIFGIFSCRLGRRVVCGSEIIVDMRQLQLFTSAALAEMRDRTAARTYCPVREEFRREHARHRDWGLAQRHGERLHRLRRQRGQSCAHDPASNGEQVAAEATPPPPNSQPTADPGQGGRDHHTEAPRGPAPATVPSRGPSSTPRRGALGPRPQSISHRSKRGHRPPSTPWARDVTNVPRRSAIRRSEAAGRARADPIRSRARYHLDFGFRSAFPRAPCGV